MANRRKTKTNRKSPSRYVAPPGDEPRPFLAHVHELRRRLMWIALSVVGWSVVGYVLQDYLISWLLAPAANQQFIYTTPGGGLNFLLQASIYFGVALSIPVLIYHVLGFIEPLVQRRNKHFVLRSTLWSVLLASFGIAFGYFVGLPAAMHFLAGMLSSNQHIEALLTLSDYLSFVTVYLAGSALIFQVPIIMFFINRIKPLSFARLMKSQRWIILGAFIVAAIITPTPDLMNQAIIALPIILLYQLSIIMVWWYNRRSGQLARQVLSKRDEAERKRRQNLDYVEERIAPQPTFIHPKAVDLTMDNAYDPLAAANNPAPKSKKRVRVLTGDE